SFVEHFSKPNHVKPGNPFITQLVPPLLPNCLPEGSGCKLAQRWSGQLRTIPDTFYRFIGSLIGAAHLILRLSIDQQNLCKTDERHIQVVGSSPRNPITTKRRGIEMFEDIRTTQFK